MQPHFAALQILILQVSAMRSDANPLHRNECYVHLNVPLGPLLTLVSKVCEVHVYK